MALNVSRTRTVLVALFLLLLAASLTNAFDTVVIDPGHGGMDEGTAWYHVKEKDTALAVALRLEKLLQERGINCVLTRSTDTYISLDDRVKVANQRPDSLLVSIHFNGSPVASNAGFSTYYFSQSPSGTLPRLVPSVRIRDGINFDNQLMSSSSPVSNGADSSSPGRYGSTTHARALGSSGVMRECGVSVRNDHFPHRGS